MLFVLKVKVAETKGATHGFWRRSEQSSKLIYLDHTKEYFYTAYLADHGKHYDFQLGMFGERTSHTQSDTSKAKDEIQVISIESIHVPKVIVSVSWET